MIMSAGQIVLDLTQSHKSRTAYRLQEFVIEQEALDACLAPIVHRAAVLAQEIDVGQCQARIEPHLQAVCWCDPFQATVQQQQGGLASGAVPVSSGVESDDPA